MGIRKITAILGLIFITMQSCNTYKTFYSETITEFKNANPSKILRLDLSVSTAEIIIEDFKKLKHIKMLNLSGRKNAEINNIIEKLPNPETLEVLLLNDLDLKIIPSEIKRFINLKQLSLNNNPNMDWGKCFGFIKNLPLKFLDLQKNGLVGLPVEISEIKTLKDLNLSHNKINDPTIFGYLAKLPKLNSLWLSHNNLENLPPEIGQLNQLFNLYIGHNNLKTLPKEITQMKQLWVFHAEYNDFKELPVALIEMPFLWLLHINNCKIEIIPEVFATQKFTIKGLIMDNNNLTETEKNRWKNEFNDFFLLSME